MRFGLVGAGMMGREHLRNLALIPGAEVVALVDPVAASLERAAGEGRAAEARRFSKVEAMLREARPDAVIVASPNHTHRAVLEELFGTGVHILCEKPLATTVADAAWIAARAAAHDGVFWVGMGYRFMPPVARFIADAHGGAAGRLVRLAIHEHRFPFLPKVGDWNRFAENTGGTMVEKCCHFFDLMRLILRSEPVRVFCSGAMDVNHRDERYGGRTPDIIDNSFTVVDFADGTRAMLDLCMFADGVEEQERLTAIGDAAALEVTIPGGVVSRAPRVPLGERKRVERVEVPVEARVLGAGSHHGGTYFQLRAFMDAVAGRGPVRVTAADGLASVRMGAAAERSAAGHDAIGLQVACGMP